MAVPRLSERYWDLQKRLTELRSNLLPTHLSPVGSYSERQFDMVRGYRLLCHAEIEAYLEDRCLEAAKGLVSAWRKNRKPTLGIVAFITMYKTGWYLPDDDATIEFLHRVHRRPSVQESSSEIADHALTEFGKRVKDNNGIREPNMRMLVMPVGVDLRDLDHVWLTEMDEFGKRRGDIAHQSKTTHTKPDPADERRTVDTLLLGIKNLDRRIGAVNV